MYSLNLNAFRQGKITLNIEGGVSRRRDSLEGVAKVG